MGIHDFGVTPLQDLRSPDARDAARDLPAYPSPTAAPVADVAATPDGSFDWGDAAIGAAMTLALLGIAAGSLLLVGRRRWPFRAAQ